MKKAAFLLIALSICLFWLGRQSERASTAHVPEVAESQAESGLLSTVREQVKELLEAAPARDVPLSRAPLALDGGIAVRVVLKKDYEPLAHFDVQLVGRDGERAARAPQKTYDSANWGGLLPGRYRVDAWAEGWQPAAQDVELMPGTVEAEAFVRLYPLNWLAGDVIDRHDGRVLTAFRVQVEMESKIGILPARELRIQAVDGRFALGGAPSIANRLRLVVSAEGYLATITEWFSADARVDGLIVSMNREGLAQSLVRARAVHTTGAPAAGTKTILVDSGATMESVRLYGTDALVYASADVTGEIAYGGARAETDVEGWARVVTRYDGPARLLVVPREGRAFLTEPFELSHGREVDLGEIRIEAGGAIAGNVWIGDLPSGAVVRSVSARHDRGTSIFGRLAEDGSFHIGGLDAGSYRVSALCEFSYPAGTSTATFPMATVSAEIGHLETAYVELYCGVGLVGSSVHGRVEPVEGLNEVRVLVLDVDLSPVRMAFARDDGSFRITDIPEGVHTLAVVARNENLGSFAAAWQPLSLPSTSSTTLHVRLRHSRVEILVPNAAGGELHATALTGNSLFDDLVGAAIRGKLDTNGSCVIWGLPAGAYRFRTPQGDRRIEIPAEGGVFRIEM